MTNIKDSITKLRSSLPEHVTLVAVSKTKPKAVVEEAYGAGQRHFGENKVQDLVNKYESLPKDIKWHFIGHLQSNKVKYIAPFVHLIHGVDSASLLKEINKRAKNCNRVIDVLLQVHIAQEDSKFGFKKSEIIHLYKEDFFSNLHNLRIKGLMGMSTLTTDQNQISTEFKGLQSFFEELKLMLTDEFEILSMGMSGDYNIAIENGSTMVRIGSTIFGTRT